MFRDYLQRWNLVPDGEAIVTSTSQLLPVRADGAPAMLKVVTLNEEKRGGQLLEWWDGHGAARVLARADNAVLLERAEGRSLAQLVRGGEDDQASQILCAVTAQLHASRTLPPPALPTLVGWFQPLMEMGRMHGGVLWTAAEVAVGLLNCPREMVVLHGDLHHANILHFGPRGWLAIDPKGLIGERYFDYANLLCNPDFAVALRAGRLQRQIEVVAAAAHLQRGRLLAWVMAWAGLSVAFRLEDGLPTQEAFAFAETVAKMRATTS